MSEGFLGRWSRRKADVREGKPVEGEPAIELENRAPPPQPSPGGGGGEEVLHAAPGDAPEARSEPPPPTLEDVKTLTAESDFRRFVTPGVAPEVKNAALKKLFADPHFNVMDGLDVYIDDYSKPDPMPEAMLRKLSAARFLRLFEEKPKDDGGAGEPRDVAYDAGTQTVAQSSHAPEAISGTEAVDDDPDLRLQQDDAAAGEEPGRGTG
ncbi:DUF3306 domain-containing protein [Ramlibacter tataouinensis]|uniref:DUF3306 domain-containing protein n=1 Tax=Ramlibacter tataouinensis TaxID=94132 RepID=A0A127K000_9BURK|nr:DUF3306 domain-containing protein [Ramlibacter tataouinensis]AMO25527.1 hypothetical protein UC35_16925 [Ramlibacter tataouinensis]